MVEKDTYTCFTCLMESKTPVVCSECGADIPDLDAHSAIVKPPRFGKLVIHSSASEDFLEEIKDIISKQSSETFDNYEVLCSEESVVIKCNEKAADRLRVKLLSGLSFLDEHENLVQFQAD